MYGGRETRVGGFDSTLRVERAVRSGAEGEVEWGVGWKAEVSGRVPVL